MILSVAVNLKGCFTFAQIHQHPGSILQTAKISDMVVMVVGQDYGVDMFQVQIGLNLSQHTGTAVKQYVVLAGLQEVSRSGLPGSGVCPPPADDG
jgi:UDP-N-acetylglucosamine transferase subunit ALG13